jgi:hypothetical protein
MSRLNPKPCTDLLSYHKVAHATHKTVDRLTVADIVYATTEHGATREVLFKEKSAFNYIHFFYEDEPDQCAKEADQIIATIRTKQH